MKEEAPGGGLGVDAVGGALEVYLPSFKFVNEVHQSLKLRPSRSSFQTTRVSASCKWDRASFSPGRSTCAPLSLSVKMRSHPTLLSASSCNSRFWSRVDTRAYPIRMA